MRAYQFHQSIAVVALVTALLPTPAFAQTSVAAAGERFALPSQDLGTAIDRIVARFGVRIDVDRVAIRQFRSSAVVDATSAEDAVGQALQGTGLTATHSADGATIGIGMPDPGRLATDIVVTARRSQAETSYKADSSETGTRTGGPSKSLPASSSVVTAQVLKDQQAQTIEDAVRNVGSVKTALGNVQGVNTFQVRGFVANVLSNGTAVGQGVYQPIDSTERVEVLKGPAAILQGQSAYGGVINVVTKKPTTTTLLDASVQAGSYDEYKVAVDGSIALDAAKNWSARFVASGFDQGRTYGGYDGGHQILVNPSLRYKDAALDATVSLTRSEQTTPLQPYTQFTTDTHRLVDREGAVAYRNQRFEFATTAINASIDYEVAPWLTLVARGTHSRLHTRFIYFSPFTRVSSTDPLIGGLRAGQDNRTKSDSGDAYLRAKFTTGPLRHTVSAGYNRAELRDVRRSISGADGQEDFYFPPFFPGATDDRINFLADAPLPRYGAYRVSDGSRRVKAVTQGYYIQDLVEFGPFHVFGALRRNLYRANSRSLSGTSVFTTDESESAWTPSVGVVADLTKTVSIYGNYVQGFFPTDVRTFAGDRLPPIRAEQFEGGTKVDLNQSKATFALSGFQITEQNRPQVDNINSRFPNIFYVLGGGLRSRGIEAELTGEILPGWNVTLSGTRSWYKNIAQDVPLTGDPYASLVKARASLWTVYNVKRGPLQGFGAGGGFTVQGSSTATGEYDAATDTFLSERVPGFFRTDLSLYYRKGPIDLTLGVRNVFDRKDYSEASTAIYVPILPPRTLRLTLTFHGFRQ